MAGIHYLTSSNGAEGLMCPACQMRIREDDLVEQECRCRLKICGNCLSAWCEALRRNQPPADPSCMICREPLDLTGLLQPTIQVQWRSQVQIDQEEREMILEAAGTSTNLYNPARAATDRTNPEVAMAAIRQRNIESMRPPRALTRVLYVQQTTFYGELTRQNTFFVSGSYEEQEMILIAANYGLGNTAFTYYFWAHQDTRMGELAELWNSAEFGSVWVRSLDNLPAISAIWTFNGERIAWTSTVGDLGMVNGSRFRIFLPNPTAIRSNGLAIRAPR